MNSCRWIGNNFYPCLNSSGIFETHLKGKKKFVSLNIVDSGKHTTISYCPYCGEKIKR